MTRPADGSRPAPPAPEREISRWHLGRDDLRAIVGFWTLFGVLTTANRLLDNRGFEPGVSPVYEGAFWLFGAYLWAAVTPLVFWLAWRFGVDRSSKLASAVILLLAGVALVTLMTAVRDVAWLILIQTEPVGREGEPWSLWGVLMRPWFLNDLVTYTGVLAAGIAREYFVRYRVRQEEAIRLHAHTAQLQAQLTDAKLDALRMQLNPHFLFNTLHAISSLVERDPRGVRRMIARLSELLRYTLHGSNAQEITVEEEMGFLQKYLDIMQVRFQGRLEIETHVEPGVASALIPTLILQPLVENAVKHGVSNLVDTGRIEIRADRRGEWLVLSVRDNGPGPQPDTAPSDGGGVGLQNVRARLQQLFGEDQHLSLRTAEGGGALAEIELPFHTRADLREGDLVEDPAHAAHGV